MNILYFDCLSGISGDMAIGGLIDLGVEFEYLKKELEKLGIDGYKLLCEKKEKNGISGSKFDVIIKKHTHNHIDTDNHTHKHTHGRNYKDIIKLIDDSTLETSVKKMSKAIFLEIGLGESKIHNKKLDEVHFHEVGAIDSIIDIVGVSICLDKLNIQRIEISPVHLGTGFVKCDHGVIPVPAPATLEILKGIPVYSNGINSELVTPTGAGIVKVIGDSYNSMPEMEIEKIGYGHGTKDLEITNTLRIVKGKKKLKKKY